MSDTPDAIRLEQALNPNSSGFKQPREVTVIQDQVLAAYESGTPLEIVGGGSKRFYGRQDPKAPQTETLSLSAASGIVSYEPSELVITARAGTPMKVLEETLHANGQMLAFEPPHFGSDATLGGTIACGLSGPRRPYLGSLRDFVLGVRVINGRGDLMRFGGQVMKNVAGYDVSRLMAGALGTLGVLVEVSLKVLPRPAAETTRTLSCSQREALDLMNQWAGTTAPISGTCYVDERLYVRLSGTKPGVKAAAEAVGGDPLGDADRWWNDLKEQRHAFFQSGRDGEYSSLDRQPLWRLSLPTYAPEPDTPYPTLIEWSGAQRWTRGPIEPVGVRAWAERNGGHLTQFRGGNRAHEVFHPMSQGVDVLHLRLKRAFDPKGILNPGRQFSHW